MHLRKVNSDQRACSDYYCQMNCRQLASESDSNAAVDLTGTPQSWLILIFCRNTNFFNYRATSLDN